jgi:hypothetical protein
MTSAPPARLSATTSPHGDLGQGLIFDAVRVRLIEIGEAVKALDPVLLATEPGIPRRDIAALPSAGRRIGVLASNMTRSTVYGIPLRSTGAAKR